MRLVAFKMSDWKRESNAALTVGDSGYALQKQRFAALRGSAERPVTVVAVHSGRLALEFYSCETETAHVERALYMPEPVVDDHGGIWISEKCYRAAVNMIASLTLETFGDGEKAGLLKGVALDVLGINNNN